MKFSSGVVILCILMNMAFTLGVFLAAMSEAVIPDSLIIAWFGWTTGELWMLASIKKAKVKEVKKINRRQKGENET